MATTVNRYIENLKQRIQLSPLGRFWSWWALELRSALPAGWKQRLMQSDNHVWITRGEQGYRLYTDLANEPFHEFMEDDDLEITRQGLYEAIQNLQLQDPELVFLVPENVALQTDVAMPMAAERNLQQAITYDLDRQTPFRPDDVYFDYQVASRHADKAQLDVDLRVLDRELLDRHLQQFSKFGLGIHRVDIINAAADKGRGFNLLPVAQRAKRVNKRARLNWLIFGVALLLLIFVMLQSLALREQAVEELDTAVGAKQQEALLVNGMKQELEEGIEAAEFLYTQHSIRPPIIALMNEVTRIIPDDTYVERFIVNKCELQLQGLSRGAQKLIGILNDSELLDGAAFRGSIRVDNNANRERFNVSAQIKCEGEL